MDVEYQYLVAKLQEALAADDRVNTLDIKVMVSAGRLHLAGEVPSEERRSAVNDVVREVLPGIAVRNELTVFQLRSADEPEPISD